MGLYFNSWNDLERVFVLGIFGYVALILLLRASGKRTLSKLNAFDFIVTVALGSTFGSLILNKNVALADGILAFIVLIGGQCMISWLTVRSDTFKKLIKADPTLVFYKEEYLKDNMKHSRVVADEIQQAARNQGYPNMENVDAVVLETDGSLSIISQSNEGKELEIKGLKV
jgi:uncharacterized membrane protein YcaP (DUF421 family)